MSEIVHSKVLIDSAQSIAPCDWAWGSDTVHDGHTWNITHRVLHGGKQEGSQLLTITTSSLEVVLIPTRGMGIASIQAGDVRLGWDSPVREIVHPAFMNLESRNGLGWLEGFNEWMCRCGLEFSGHPGVDEFINNTGAKDTMMLTLHGKIANIPCRYADILIRKDAMVIRSMVKERVFHGPKLELWSELTIPFEGTSINIKDTVTNSGSQPQEMQMLYHCNFGFPLLQKGARFIAPVATNEPFNDRAAEGLQSYDTFDGPTPGFIEQVYKLTLKAGADRRSSVMLHNAQADRGASMSFSIDELPFFTLWKNTDAVEDGYVTGLEPGTCFPHNRRIEREKGRVITLAPGAERSFSLDVSVHLNSHAVSEQKAIIERIGA